MPRKKKPQTIQQFFKKFPTNEACLEHVMKARYGLQGTCPKCKEETRFSRVTSQRAYACQWCGWHVYPCVGTPFESSRTSLQLWFYAIYLFTQTRHGVSAKELQRQLGVTYKCAWHMGHEIREHMDSVDGEPPLSGTVEADETYVGGRKWGSKIAGRGALGKTIVLGMVQRGGDVMTKVIPNAKRSTIRPLLLQNIERGSKLHTGEFGAYNGLRCFDHETVNHGRKEYVRGGVHTNTIENFWSNLKRSIRGTHIHVSKKHLQKYAKEFEYRFNSRASSEKMLSELLSTYQKPSKKQSSQNA